MPAEMEGHAMSLTSATTWARADMTGHKEVSNELDGDVARGMASRGKRRDRPMKGKSRSGNEAYEIAKWGNVVDRGVRQRGEL